MGMVYDHWPLCFYNLWWQKWRGLEQLVAAAPDRPLLVVLGSSRAEAGLETGLLNTLPGPGGKPYLAYNFAVSGTGPLGELLSLHQMLDSGIRPRLVVAEFVPPLLNEWRKGYVSEEYWISAGRLSLSQMLTMEPYFARPDHVRRDWLESRLAPCYVLRPYLQQWGETALSPPPAAPQPVWDVWGHHALEDKSPDARASLREETYRQYGKSLGTYRLGRGPAQAMRDLAARCRQEGIPLVLVVMPESRWYHRLYSREGQAALDDLLAELRDDYHIPAIDGTGWSPSADFQDGHHLVARAAHSFTLRVHGELQRILAANHD
jgi:hypothetical protein